jgi:hydrogenase-4 component F
LATLAATVPGGIGLALAVILLGLLLVASRPLPAHQALGIAAMQNGLVLAAVTAGLSNWRLALLATPLLPAAAFGALWLGGDRARTLLLSAPRLVARIDAALCGLALLLACTLPWQLGAHGPFWRLDARAAHVILLLAALAAAASWAHRDTTPIWGSRLAILAGTVLAVLSTAPLLSWLGMALATVGAAATALPVRAEAWRRLRLGCIGLGLALFGTVALHAIPPPLFGTVALHAIAPLPATACVMLGYGALAVLAPELTVAAVALILRMRGPTTDILLLALGLTALLVAALSLATARGSHRRTLRLVGLAQGGVAVFAFGLDTGGGSLAGLLQLSLLAVTQCALLLAPRGGLDRLAALAGLAGLPPFGLFPSLALILAATAARLPWLLLPLGAGLAAVAWAVLLQLPADRHLRLSPAWVPLALLLIAGFAMPDPLLTWFRLAAR